MTKQPLTDLQCSLIAKLNGVSAIVKKYKKLIEQAEDNTQAMGRMYLFVKEMEKINVKDYCKE